MHRKRTEEQGNCYTHGHIYARPLPSEKDRALNKPHSNAREGPCLATAIFSSNGVKSNNMVLTP